MVFQLKALSTKVFIDKSVVSVNFVDSKNVSYTLWKWGVAYSNTEPHIFIGNNIQYTENDEPTPIASSGTVSDAEGNWEGGAMIIEITKNAEKADEISIVDNDGDDLQISIYNAEVFINETKIGTVSVEGQTANGGVATGGRAMSVVFNSNVTDVIVKEILQSLRYCNTSDDPGTGNREVSLTIKDNESSVGVSVWKEIEVTAVDDRPTLTYNAVNPGYTEGGAQVTIFSNVKVSTIESGQSISKFLFTVSNIKDSADEVLFMDGSMISLVDGTSGTTAANSINYNISVVNSEAKVTLINISQTILETLLNNVTYHNKSENPTTLNRVVTIISLVDSGSNDGDNENTADLSGLSYSTITVTAINDNPTITGLPSEITVLEDSESKLDLSGIVINDVDAGNNEVSLILQVQEGKLIADSGSEVTIAGSGSSVLKLTGSVSAINNYTRVVTNIKFQGTGDSNIENIVELTVSVNDNGNTGEGGGNDINFGTVDLKVTPIDDAPTLTAVAVNPTFTEGGEAVLLFKEASASTIEVGQSFVAFILTVNNVFDGIDEIVDIDGTVIHLVDGESGIITTNNFNYNVAVSANMATLSFEGASLTSEAFESLLNGVRYKNNSDNPSLLDREVTIARIIDNGKNTGGHVNTLEPSISSNITLSNVNDDPFLLGLPLDVSVIEDVSSNIDLSSLTFTDPDAGANNITVNITVGAGILTALSSGGVTVGGSGTGNLILTGSVVNIDTYLNSVSNIKYKGDLNVNGDNATIITLTANDGGNTGSGGGTDVALGIVNVDIIAVNDAPSFSIGEDLTISQNAGSQTINGFITDISDGDDGEQTVSFNVANNNNDIFSIQPFISSNGDLSFTPNSGKHGKATVTVFMQDNGGIENGGVDKSSEQTFVIYITPSNIVINEVDAVSSDKDFVELYDGGMGNMALDGLVLVLYKGEDDGAYMYYDLDGYSTNNEGYFVIGNSNVENVDLGSSTFTLPDGADAVALFVGEGFEFPNGSLVTKKGVVDAFVYSIDDSEDAGLLILLNNLQPQVNENGKGDSEHHSCQRISNGSGGQRNTQTYIQLPPTSGVRNNRPPEAKDYTLSSLYQNTAYTFTLNVWGYTDSDGDLVDKIKIVSTSVNGNLWIDDNGNNIIDQGESLITDGTDIGKDDISNSKLKYLNTNGISSSFTFRVFDGIGYSVATYTANISVIAEPTITLSIDTENIISEKSGSTKIKSTLSHLFDKDISVHLDLSGTALFGSDYFISSKIIKIKAGDTFGSATISAVDNFRDESNKTIEALVNSVENGKTAAEQKVLITIEDDDAVGFTLVQSGSDTKVDESGSTDSFTIVLNAEPTSNVVMNINSGDTGETTVDKSNVTFTTENWNSPQTITVKGIDDILADGEQITEIRIFVDKNIQGRDVDFDSLSDQLLSVITTDNEIAGIVVNPTDGNTTVDEYGTNDSFTVKLTAEPLTPVVLHLASSDNEEAIIDKTELTFTGENWDVPQTVILTGVDDHLIDGNQTANIIIGVNKENSDDAFDGIAEALLPFITKDDDVADLTIVETDGKTVISEDGITDSFSIVLTAMPVSDVVLNINSGNNDEVTVDKSILSFNSSNWDTPQIVKLRAVDDKLIEDIAYANIVISVNQADSDNDFDLVADKTVNVSVHDDDVAGFTLSNADGDIQVSESGSVHEFSVVLDAQPVSDVVMQIQSGDISVVNTDKTSLIFTKENWNIPHVVKVRGVDDKLDDGVESSNISLRVDAAQSDDDFDNLSERVIIVKVMDDDETPVIGVNQIFTIDENLPNGTLVGKVNANDGNAGTVFSDWTITGGNNSGAFEMNTLTGEITVKDSTILDWETIKSFDIYVRVSDGINVSEEEKVIINLSDVHEMLSQKITFNSISDKIYGDGSFDLDGESSSGLIVNYVSSNTNVASINGNKVTIKGAGTTTITATQVGDYDYFPAEEVQQILIVEKATLTAIADDKTKVYGQENPVLTISYEGFFNGDSYKDIIEIPQITTTAEKLCDVGSYPITLQGGEDANYTFVLVDGTLDVEQAAQNIDFNLNDWVVATAPSIELKAESTSGLPVRFESSDPLIASVEGNKLVMHKVGNVEITALQDGNNNYKEAFPVNSQLEVRGDITLAPTFSLYPVPCFTLLNVDIDPKAGGESVLEIVSMNGDKLLSKTIELPEKQILDVSNMKSGIYFIIIRKGKYSIRKKWLKK
jgi:hypothetical protein